jgi:hypothetical protein
LGNLGSQVLNADLHNDRYVRVLEKKNFVKGKKMESMNDLETNFFALLQFSPVSITG